MSGYDLDAVRYSAQPSIPGPRSDELDGDSRLSTMSSFPSCAVSGRRVVGVVQTVTLGGVADGGDTDHATSRERTTHR